MSGPLPHDYHQRFRRRVVQDAFAEAEAAYWLRRSRSFEAARPQPSDWPGHADSAQLAEQDRRLSALALACENRARLAVLLRAGDHDD